MPNRPRRWWPLLRRILLFGFAVLVVGLLVVRARSIEWAEVGAALRRIEGGTLLAAAALAAVSHFFYSCYDVLARVYTRHNVPAPRVMAVSFTSYAFGMNLGALIGGLALRARLYLRLGLKRGVIARVYSFSIVTNWLGYMLLAGGLFAARALELPEDWKIGTVGLQVLGGALLAVAAAYLAACAFSRKRSWHLRGVHLHLPSLRLAALQLALSVANWLTIAAILFVLIGKAPYATVLAILLVAAVAGTVTHIPAGLGVVEAVFLALLGETVAEGPLLAALLAYRAIYYLAPLALAVGTYLALETRATLAPARA